MALIDNTGTEVVSYTYDAWDKVISVSGTLASTVGQRNPCRYRGYRYDTKTGLHYLNSRYCNPEWGRFINSDSVFNSTGQLNRNNLFAYCENNPVTYYDPNGNIIETIIDVVSIGWGLGDLFKDPSLSNLIYNLI